MNKVASLYNAVFKEQNRTSVVIRQALYSFLLKGVSVIISFVYVPLLLNYLDSEKYGIWLTLVTVTNWVTLFDIGLGNGLRNKLTEALADRDLKLGRTYISTTYALLGIITLALLLAFNAVNQFIPWNSFLNSKLIAPQELLVVTSIAFSGTILRFFFQLIGVIFLAHQQSSMNDLINTVSSFCSLIGVALVSLLMPPGNLILLSAIITLTPVLVYLTFTVISFTTRFKELQPSISQVRLSYSKPLFLLSSQFFIVQVTALIIYASANVLVANLFNPSEVILYNIAFTIFNATIMVMTLCLSPIWSSVTEAYALRDFDYLKKMLRRLNYLSVLFSLGVLLLLAISNPLYHIWLKGKVEIPFTISLAMALYAIIYMFQAPYSAFINGMGKVRFTSFLAMPGIIVYLLGAIFISRYLNSSAGVITGITLSSLIGLVIQRIQVSKLLNNRAKGIWAA
ncbi:O-antigen/teichoic acid export membrane protein [Arcticibacter pallidicorallinus]|uniref:O-antigen/teichoic acid export membrane protein n=1 Tax=Arcticibacter pallidicorallinus TaxID=1259464 RepID=A0A2T0UBL1_9SPHI|nr:oligosaccharide flippase family protein [Arcticibacter pallidicorallinus]PRY55326.1 O-antigen/teichoic acid export membrane protein [Arcticibacter pallidicorallinus]